eukprot:TRINITY_DN3239_c0_g1_i2.p1 TRINITY_DN3239_c0_g1~~TRINITY_DN3239_c0_g1_i2.p1  ORF type:complete len:176 (+),score=51.34 TRINITY_DN3239_c0_g1_i2:44-529(+)
MADLDRLTPSYKSREMVRGRKGAVSPVTCVQHQARGVVRKYRRNVRYSQLRRLKEMIPILAQQGTVDEVDILEETTRYILSLEQKLLEKVREHGLPEKLKMKDNPAVCDDLSDNEDVKGNIDINMMKSILHKFAQPEIERKLEDQKIEDEKQILEILETGR